MDCTIGCSKLINPICVANRTTYQNSCLAHCQGKSEFTQGACANGDVLKFTFRGSGTSSGGIVDSAEVDTSPIAFDTMHKYKQEGYELVGFIEISDDPPQISDTQNYTSSGSTDYSSDNDETRVVRSIRITPDGEVYLCDLGSITNAENRKRYLQGSYGTSVNDATTDNETGGEIPFNTKTAKVASREGGRNIELSNNHGAELPYQKNAHVVGVSQSNKDANANTDANTNSPSTSSYTDAYAGTTSDETTAVIADSQEVLGYDTRTKVTDTSSTPFKRIGDIDNPGCTGSIVGSSWVLTAAHCYYDMNSNTYFQNTKFTPGGFMANGIRYYPYGLWDVEYVEFDSRYASEGNRAYDFALMKLKPNSSGVKVGDMLGMFQLRALGTTPATCGVSFQNFNWRGK